MGNKKVDTELLKAMMMGDYSPSSPNDTADEWISNDLHSKEKSNKKKVILNQQIENCKRVIDKAIVNHRKEMVIIHGKGTGILQHEVHAILKNHSMVKRFEIDKNNTGQTIVYFK